MEGGGTTWVHITDVKYILPVNNIIANLPNYQILVTKLPYGLIWIKYQIYIGNCLQL